MEDTYLKDNIKKCVDYVMSKNDDDKRRILNGMFQYNDYLINEQLVVKALNDEEKQEWFNNEIFEEKDKEIERLNKENEYLNKKHEKIIHNIMEFIDKNTFNHRNTGDRILTLHGKGILDLLDICLGSDKE